jgi:hypothetical protein
MFYQNFDNNITAKWGVVLKNWPLPILCSPSDIGSRNEVRLLYQAWESGTTYFQRLTEDEFNEWENNRFNDALDQMVAQVDDVDDTNDNDNNGNSGNDGMETSVEPGPVAQTTSIPGTTRASSLDHEDRTPSSSVPPATTHMEPPFSATDSAQRTPAEPTSKTSHKKARPAPFESFINTATATDGTTVQMTKKPRKVRSDKGKKRGSRSKENAGPGTASN